MIQTISRNESLDLARALYVQYDPRKAQSGMDQERFKGIQEGIRRVGDALKALDVYEIREDGDGEQQSLLSPDTGVQPPDANKVRYWLHISDAELSIFGQSVVTDRCRCPECGREDTVMMQNLKAEQLYCAGCGTRLHAA